MDTLTRRRPAFLSVLFLAFVLAGTARAADNEPPAASPDRDADMQVRDLLKTLHDRGADLYNKGNAAGSYQVLRGALMAVQPLLGGHPDLQRRIGAGLANAERLPAAQQQAFVLHALVEEVRGGLKEGPKGADKKPEEKTAKETKPPEKPPEEAEPVEKKPPRPAAPLWDRLGGEPGVRMVVDDFTTLAASDPKVDFTRHGQVQLTPEAVNDFKDKMVAFVSQATGGPLKYTGKSMKEAHQGMGITDAEFDAVAADLREVLENHKVQPADIAAVLGAVEGTRKDIVEKAEEKKPEKKKPADTKPGGKTPEE